MPKPTAFKIYCCYCGILLHQVDKGKVWNTEHLLPRSKGGNHSSVNLQPCCIPCNQERGNLEYDQWLAILRKKWLRSPKSSPIRYELEIKIENVNYWKYYVETAGFRLMNASRRREITRK